MAGALRSQTLKAGVIWTRCQSKLDTGLIEKLDEYLVRAGPNEVIVELDTRVKAGEKENLVLRKHAFELSPCR